MTKRDDKEIEHIEMLACWINFLSFQIHSSLGVLHYKIDRQNLEKKPNLRIKDKALIKL
jgi:hypothetical protein